MSKFHIYTKGEDEWIKEHLDDDTYEKLKDSFNKKFDTDVSYHSFTSHVLKQLKLNKKVNRGNIPKGERICTNTLPVGHESVHDGYVWVKVADNVNDCKHRRMPNKLHDPNWMRKDYLVWTQAGNRFPAKSELLIHLDGDRLNCEIYNLYLTTRKINFMLSKNKWHFNNRDLTLAAIKWCELFYARKEKS